MTQTQKPLENKVVNAGFWSFLLHAGSRALGFARTLILARLLSPDDIGLFAISTIALTLIETFFNPGFTAALIQKKGTITEAMNVAWTVQVILGFSKAGILFLIAPLAANFFQAAPVTSFIRTVAFTMLINGFLNIGVVFLRKELNFKKHFAFMLAGFLAELLVAVAAAIYFMNAWALVYGLVARHVVQTILSFFIHPFRPRLKLDAVICKKLFGYGIWVNLMGVMVFFANDCARVVIGKFVDTYALGLYQIAFWITESAVVEMAGVFGVVAFAAYSKIQSNPVALRNAFIRTAGFMLSVIFPVTAGLILAGDLFLSLFLGEKWLGSIPVLILLTISGCFLAIANTSQPIYLALGKPKFSFYLQTLRAVIMLSLVIPFTVEKGAEGAAAATIVSNAGMLFCSLYYIKKTLTLSRFDFVRLFAPGLIATTVMIVGVLSLKSLTDYIYTFQKAESFAAIIILGGFIYLFTLKKLEPRFPGNQPLKALGLLAEIGLKKKG